MHLDFLSRHIPELMSRRMLDVGSGRGKFLDAVPSATGLEYNKDKAEACRARGRNAVHGNAEQMPFPDSSFGFVNLSEVIEHTKDPTKVLSECYRVLEPGGYMYASFPSRFAIKDPHYHIWFINWLPRFAVPFLISQGEKLSHSGEQKLTEMHYYTYRGAKHALLRAGFGSIKDTRLSRLPWFLRPVYFLCAGWLFDAHHFVAQKQQPLEV